MSAVLMGLCVLFAVAGGVSVVVAVSLAANDADEGIRTPAKWWLIAAAPVAAGLATMFGSLA